MAFSTLGHGRASYRHRRDGSDSEWIFLLSHATTCSPPKGCCFSSTWTTVFNACVLGYDRLLAAATGQAIVKYWEWVLEGGWDDLSGPEIMIMTIVLSCYSCVSIIRHPTVLWQQADRGPRSGRIGDVVSRWHGKNPLRWLSPILPEKGCVCARVHRAEGVLCRGKDEVGLRKADIGGDSKVWCGLSTTRTASSRL